jgi:hypothetical protein
MNLILTFHEPQHKHKGGPTSYERAEPKGAMARFKMTIPLRATMRRLQDGERNVLVGISRGKARRAAQFGCRGRQT